MDKGSGQEESMESTVFVIDDDESVRKGLLRLLVSMGFQPEAYGSAEEFLEREPFGGIGCIILDVRMPGLTGIDLQEKLSAEGSSLPIIFITGHGTIPLGVTAMKRGAVDFLQKPFDEDVLLEAVQKAVANHREFRSRQWEEADARQRMGLLTPREKDVFHHVVQGKLNKQIACALAISEKTVKIHRGHIMEKLSVSSVADLVRLAERLEWNRGYTVSERPIPNSSI